MTSRDRRPQFRLREFLADESAQATSEYILLLSIAVAFFLILLRTFFRPVIDRMKGTLVRSLEAFFSKGNLHRLRIGR